MENSEESKLRQLVAQPRCSAQKRRVGLPVVLATAALLLLLVRQMLNTELPEHIFNIWRKTNTGDDNTPQQKQLWDWSDVTPHQSLEWESCFEGFECAKVDVPLDWLEPSNETRVALAVIRLRATDMTDYKGPVFVNPGGPGSSGVKMVKTRGKYLQTVIGVNHDIISFDPRGVGASTPRLNCWTSQQSHQIWSLLDVGTIDSHPGVLHDAYARAAAESALCASRLGGGNMSQSDFRASNANEARVREVGPLRFVGTTSTARDMLEILDHTGWPGLRYWGFSYGSMLGGTFATLFPDRVGRLVSDGNVDYEEWGTTAHLHFLTDSDQIMTSFYHFCHLAGPLRCDFYAPTPSVISSRLDTLLAQLKIHPITTPAPAGGMGVPEMVFYSSVRRLIASSLYRPILMFPRLATVLAALECGDGGPFIEFVMSEGERKPFSCQEGGDDGPNVPAEADVDGAFKGIMCSDGPAFEDDVEAFEEYAGKLQETSKAAGAVYILFKMACVGWKISAKWRHTGSFSANTSFPILFLANTADNVTPLRSARRNAANFNGSTLLIQNSYGHTTLSAPSLCTAKYVRAYFQNGTVPAFNTTCEADAVPFGDRNNSIVFLSDEDKSLSDALWELALQKHGLHF